MNTKATVLFGALCVCSGLAVAQPKVSGKLPPLEKLPLDLQWQLDPKLPPYPNLDPKGAGRVQVRVLDTYRGPLYQLEVVQMNHEQILESLLAALGARFVIDPELKQKLQATRYVNGVAVLRAPGLEGLLNLFCEGGIEKWKSPSGVYFFTQSSASLKSDKMLQEMMDKRKQDFQRKRQDPDFDPFVLPFGKPQQPNPQPEWRKHEFNGRDVYEVPLPNPLT